MADGKKPTQQITEFNALYQQAAESQQLYSDRMHEYLAQLRARYPGMLDNVRFEQGPLKTPERALAKINGEYEGDASKIADLVRGRFVVSTAEQADILRRDLLQHPPFKVEKLKDQFAEPTDTLFRAENAQIRLSNGHLAELRVEHEGMLEASKGTHKLYQEKQEIERKVIAENRDYTPEEKNLLDKKLDEIKAIHDRAAVEGNLDSLLSEKGRAEVYAFRAHADTAMAKVVVPPVLMSTLSPNEHSHTLPPVLVTKPARPPESPPPVHVLRKLGLAGATAQLAIGPAFEATLSAANDGNASDVTKAGLHGLANSALPGVTTGFKNITENNEHQNWLDQTLNAGTTATQGVAVGALVVAGGSAAAAPVTGGASLTVTAGSLVVAGVSGIANLGIGVVHDVTYWTGLSKQGGLITGVVGMGVQLADSKAGLRTGDWLMNNDATVQRELAAKGIKLNQLAAVDANHDGKITAQETRDYLIKRNIPTEQVNTLHAKELADKLVSIVAPAQVTAHSSAAQQAQIQVPVRTTAGAPATQTHQSFSPLTPHPTAPMPTLEQSKQISPDMLKALNAAMGCGLSASISCDAQSANSHTPAAKAVPKQSQSASAYR